MGRLNWDRDWGTAIITAYDHIGASVYVLSAVREANLPIVEDLVDLNSRQAVRSKFLLIGIIE